MDLASEPSPAHLSPDRGMAQPGEVVISEVDLWRAVRRREVTGLAELFRRHGAVAYAFAQALTKDPEAATQAVVAAFNGLGIGWPESGRPRALRVEVLDATRRSAQRQTPPAPYSTMSTNVGAMLALAVAGRCTCNEIGMIMQVDRATVQRDLLVGLRHAAAVLETPADTSLDR